MIIKLLRKIFSKFHVKKIIIFESYPDFSDSPHCIFEELKRRGIDKKCIFVWQLSTRDEVLLNALKGENARYYFETPNCFGERVKLSYYRHNADVIVCGNTFVRKYFEKQKYLYVTHGIGIKDVSDTYHLPEYLCDVDALSLSENLSGMVAHAVRCKEENILPFGLPRNDDLINSPVDLHMLFSEKSFNKSIFWLPTYRKHRNADIAGTSISIPVIHNPEICKNINEYAKSNNTLIVLKPHFAQDLSSINVVDYSNIVFIDENFLINNGITNYQFLGSFDALLSDYSSVIYDFLICDKPIGLCWEDLEEFRNNFGLVENAVEQIADACTIINSADDLKSFIDEISNGVDSKKYSRKTVNEYINKYSDGKSTERVTDYIVKEYLNI